MTTSFPAFTPGEEAQRRTVVTIEDDGYYMQEWRIIEHIGTHVDAPGHFTPGGRLAPELELSELIAALNPVLRGWGNHFRHAAAKRTLEYLGYYAWWRVGRWLRKKHPRLTWKQIQRRYASEGMFQDKGIALFDLGSISVTRYRYRGARIPNPWTIEPTADPSGLRTQRASREERLSLERVRQALKAA